MTIAGSQGTSIDTTSALYLNLLQAFQELGDPHLPVEAEPCEIILLVITAAVKVLADFDVSG